MLTYETFCGGIFETNCYLIEAPEGSILFDAPDGSCEWLISKEVRPKLLLLTHAFEVLNCGAVEFRTSWFNHASRNAIARLGAKQDGILRNHMLMSDGSYRDTVVFSIVANEWPMVKRHLQFKLEQAAARS